MKPEPVLKLLREARALLAAGWCQVLLYQRRAGQACYCAQAALSQAATGQTWRAFPEMAAVYAVLNEEVRRTEPACMADAVPLTAFNDRPGRTQAEVLALFDRAIRRVKEEGMRCETDG